MGSKGEFDNLLVNGIYVPLLRLQVHSIIEAKMGLFSS